MTLKLPSAVVLILSCTSMVWGGQTLETGHDSSSGETTKVMLPAFVDLSSRPEDAGPGTSVSGDLLGAPLLAGNDTLALSNTGKGLPGSPIGWQIDATRFDLAVESLSGTKAKALDNSPAAESVWPIAHEFTLNAGLAVTPNRKATESGTWNQESRNGPSLGVEYQVWKSVFTELNYVNTNTRLQDYAINTWTMNRLSVDAGYERRWRKGNLAPFLKVGTGVMVLMSGHATNNTNVGLDDRMEVLTGAGIRYRLSDHVSAVLEYEGRIIRNPDFTDHSWKPERNFLSQGTLGISYVFGTRSEKPLHRR